PCPTRRSPDPAAPARRHVQTEQRVAEVVENTDEQDEVEALGRTSQLVELRVAELDLRRAESELRARPARLLEEVEAAASSSISAAGSAIATISASPLCATACSRFRPIQPTPRKPSRGRATGACGSATGAAAEIGR